ncbi:hypothetical protein [Oceanobacter mangrovi]|uniref:hypothetical protein n=1 Tax=Oceanobacter mangrovi TaxID=2862510 RepID=UPI001C8E2821|nr:hypothetical protein [Oceanobacter mangrovi]
MDNVLSNVSLLIFFGFMGFVLWSMFSKTGKGRILGGKIVHTANDEIIQAQGTNKTTIRAHVIETNSGSKHVGIELSDNAKLAASMRPIKLTKQEAESLINMIKEVVEKT